MMRHARVHQALAGAGALAASIAVALAAYASHALEGRARYSALLAVAFLLTHGIAVAALAWTPPARSRLGLGSLCAIGMGCLLFSGSLLGGALRGLLTALAPFGGGLMIAAWLAYALACWRARPER